MTQPSSVTTHYFQFSRDFEGGRRLCADCRLSYDAGDHIEITTLKPYTHYVCPAGGGLGHSSIWTGAYYAEFRTLRDHLCICGAELVAEDDERWQISWEMQSPFSGGDWVPQHVVRSRHAAHEQHAGLLQLIEQGEPIRNVRLVQVGGPPAAASAPPTGAELIDAERQRQVDVEGWTLEHDKEHGAWQLYRAGTAYLWGAANWWPFDRGSWKPKSAFRNLVRAGALFQAAMDLEEDPLSRGRYLAERDNCARLLDELIADVLDAVNGSGGPRG